jgi:hypothetical protein
VFTGRDPNMTDAEALARLAAPKTGEVWFPTPRPIPAPSWVPAGDYLADPSIQWFELGTRNGNTIVTYVDPNIQEIFERSPGGVWQWIGSPSAREDVTGGTGVTFGYPEVPLNETVYYDSLTLPSHFALPSGEPLNIYQYDRGGPTFPGQNSGPQPTGTPVDSLGGYTILRFATPVSLVWSDYYGVTAPPGVTYQDMYYVLKTPYGMYIPLFYTPFAELSDITWSVPTTFSSDQYTYVADLNDISCGVWEKDHNTIVTGIPSNQWTPGGVTALGNTVYVPKATNPLVQPLYDAYKASKDAAGQSAESMSAFVGAPGFVGYVMPGTSTWLVYLNGTYSGRAWC